jgi:hypothetical protein
MDDALSHLPDDPAALRAIIAAVTRQRDEAQLKALRLEVELLRLKKWYYGPRADRLRGERDVVQMLLSFAGELEARPVDPSDLPPEADAGTDAAPDAAKAEGEALSASVRRIKRGRRNLAAFDHLPVSRHVHDLGEQDKPCAPAAAGSANGSART